MGQTQRNNSPKSSIKQKCRSKCNILTMSPGPLTQHRANNTGLSPTRKLINLLPWSKGAGRSLQHGFYSPAHDALSFLRYTCRHRALNPAPGSHMCQMLPFFFVQRCWRISRSIILQGGKMGAGWGQRAGNAQKQQKKTLAESEHFFPRWERGMSWRNYGWEGIQRTDQWDTSHRRTKLSHVFSSQEGLTGLVLL